MLDGLGVLIWEEMVLQLALSIWGGLGPFHFGR